jgi:molybdenum cofactor biosynthesis enzyme MoaA
MKIQTFSIVAGTRACDAHCPFCVSKMTGFDELAPGAQAINERNFVKAARLAERAGTTTVLLTGKGEPVLYPDEITRYLELLAERPFPLVELQTNALTMGWLARDGVSRSRLTKAHLARWYDLGLDTIAVSVVDVERAANASIYHDDYPDLGATVDFLKSLGFSIRLCVMLQRGLVDNPSRLSRVVAFCRERGVEQLTVRSIRRPDVSASADAASYVDRHGLTDGEIDVLHGWVRERGTLLLTLMHGARVYDVGGQNVCVSDCLTVEAESDNVRTLIFFSDGRVAYDWQHDGAVLLGGRARERSAPAGA